MVKKIKMCSYEDCKSKSEDNNIKFFNFPRNEQRTKLWIKSCHNENLSKKTLRTLSAKYYVCCKHFLNTDYTRCVSPYKTKLNIASVPIKHKDAKKFCPEPTITGSTCNSPNLSQSSCGSAAIKSKSTLKRKFSPSKKKRFSSSSPIIDAKKFCPEPTITGSTCNSPNLSQSSCGSAAIKSKSTLKRKFSPSKKKRFSSSSPIIDAKKFCPEPSITDSTCNSPNLSQSSCGSAAIKSKSTLKRKLNPSKKKHFSSSSPIIDANKEIGDPKLKVSNGFEVKREFLQSSKSMKENTATKNRLQADVGNPIAISSPKRKVKKRVKRLKKQSAETITLTSSCTMLRPVVGDFLSTMCTRKIVTNERSRAPYSTAMKNASLALFFLLHRRLYSVINKLLPLAEISTVDKWIKNWQCKPGINVHTMNLLKLKMTLDVQKSLAVLVIDDFSIRKGLDYDIQTDTIMGFEDDGVEVTKHPAAFATVFMVQGIIDKWRQPVGYVLSKSPTSGAKLTKLITTYIDELAKVGVKILATSTDQGSNFQKAFNLMKINKEKYSKNAENPECETLSGIKFINIKDVSHLGKNARNFLLNKDLCVPKFGKEKLASFKHIRDFYNKDRQRYRVLAHKLKEHHVYNLKGPSLMKVKTALQVLSNSVSSALKLYEAIGELPKEVLATATYCKKFNSIIDVLNSHLLRDKCFLRRPFKLGSSSQSILTKGIVWLKKLRELNPTNYFINGFISSMYGVLLLSKQLLKEYGVEKLRTRNLCSDSIENFFYRIRQTQKFPTAQGFSHCFRKVCGDIIIKKSLSYHSSNCEQDGLTDLLKIEDFLEDIKRKSVICNDEETIIFDKEDEKWDVPLSYNVDSIDKNGAAYIAGVLLCKLRVFHSKEEKLDLKDCSHCAQLQSSDKDFEYHLYTEMRQYTDYDSKTAVLNYASCDFVNFIILSDDCFEFCFRKYANKPRIKERIKKFISLKVQFPKFCNNTTLNFVLDLYVRTKIYYRLKQINSKLNVPGSRCSKKKEDDKLRTILHL